MNSLNIKARLTRDVEVKTTRNGKTVANFGVAMNNYNPSGEDRVVFLDITMWGSRAEAFAKFHGKGDECLLTGRLDMDEWQDKDTGKKRTKVYMTAQEWSFCGSKTEETRNF